MNITWPSLVHGQAIVAIITALLVALSVTGFMLGYARRHGMLDQPGHRRSHQFPTPRGGGLGLVSGALLGMLPVLFGHWPTGLVVAFSCTAVLVAMVGWLDDRHGLPVLPRLLVHILATLVFCVGLLITTTWSPWWLAVLVLVATWSINLHNFMDGTDGMLGLQLVFTGVLSAGLCLLQGHPQLVTLNLVLTASAMGFLVYNLPPARIFMGDAGSGFAGVLVFMLGALWCREDANALWPLLIVHTIFAIDAGMTLVARMWRGRRWYTAHREHLYQWLVRSGCSHGRTGCLYLTYNVVVVAPVAWLAMRYREAGPWLCTTLYVLSAIVWWQMRRHCLQRVMRRVVHAQA